MWNPCFFSNLWLPWSLPSLPLFSLWRNQKRHLHRSTSHKILILTSLIQSKYCFKIETSSCSFKLFGICTGILYIIAVLINPLITTKFPVGHVKMIGWLGFTFLMISYPSSSILLNICSFWIWLLFTVFFLSEISMLQFIYKNIRLLFFRIYYPPNISIKLCSHTILRSQNK